MRLPHTVVRLCVFRGSQPLQLHTHHRQSKVAKHIIIFSSVSLCEPARVDVLSVCTILLSAVCEHCWELDEDIIFNISAVKCPTTGKMCHNGSVVFTFSYKHESWFNVRFVRPCNVITKVAVLLWIPLLFLKKNSDWLHNSNPFYAWFKQLTHSPVSSGWSCSCGSDTAVYKL